MSGEYIHWGDPILPMSDRSNLPITPKEVIDGLSLIEMQVNGGPSEEYLFGVSAVVYWGDPISNDHETGQKVTDFATEFRRWRSNQVVTIDANDIADPVAFSQVELVYRFIKESKAKEMTSDQIEEIIRGACDAAYFFQPNRTNIPDRGFVRQALM
jgi:hypothetical protein